MSESEARELFRCALPWFDGRFTCVSWLGDHWTASDMWYLASIRDGRVVDLTVRPRYGW